MNEVPNPHSLVVGETSVFRAEKFASGDGSPIYGKGRAEAMNSVLMEKLLQTVIEIKASDLHITTGQPPVVRHQGRMRRLAAKILDNNDTTALMKSITPDRCQQELQEKGGSDFAIEFVDGYRFRVAIFKQRGNIGLVLRRIPSQFLTPEQLGLPEVIKRLITRPRGLLLV